MAHASRNVRKKARTRRNLTLARKEARTLNEQVTTLNGAYWQAHSTLLMILQQRGGQVTVTQGTIQQVLTNLRDLTWKSGPNPDAEGEVIITLMDNSAEAVVDPKAALTITHLPDDDADAKIEAAVAACSGDNASVPVEQTTGAEVI